MGAQVRAPLPGGGGVARRFGAVLPRLALPASLRSCSPSGTPLAARALLHGADCRLPKTFIPPSCVCHIGRLGCGGFYGWLQ